MILTPFGLQTKQPNRNHVRKLIVIIIIIIVCIRPGKINLQFIVTTRMEF